MNEVAKQVLLDIERELTANLASPRQDTLAFLNDALARLREFPFRVEPARRVERLLTLLSSFIIRVKACSVVWSLRRSQSCWLET